MVFYLTAILVILADQVTKLLIRANLDVGQSTFELGFFRITHIYNTGASFGLFPEYTLPLIIIGLVAVSTILVIMVFFPHRFPVLNNQIGRLALGLLLGGAAGNLIDRLRLGHATDFLNFNIWPAFNVADSAITVGIILFAYALLKSTAALDR
ncbi:MAG: signal peptidase II [Dehalococcoidales bacterium]|nr:MAG: signal peptidase II [Dehalococcoidales bacterium]